MLKQVLNSIVALLLIISTTGVIINKHYSGGELFSAALFIEAESCCETSCCHHEHQNNCHEVSEFYKLVADYTITDKLKISNVLPGNLFHIDLTGFEIPASPRTSQSHLLTFQRSNAPPLQGGLHVLYHSLLL
mgnify:CR=1 FL=1